MTQEKTVKAGFFPTSIDVENAPIVKAAKSAARNDGWTNVLTGLGHKVKDRSMGTSFANSRPLTYDELSELYAGDGPATRIVNSVSDDMVRNSWRIAGDDAKETLYKMGEEIHLTARVAEAIRWQRLFGGALLVREYANDGAKLDRPVRKNAKLVRIRVYAAPQVMLGQCQFSTDPSSPYFDDIEVFQVKKKYGGDFRIHASRCEVLKGQPWPPAGKVRLTLEQKYWGMSELQAPYVPLSILGAFVQGIGHAGQEMAVSKYRLSNLMQMLAENSTDALYRRMEAIEASKSLINAVLLGKDEEWGRDQLSFVGLPEVFDRLAMMVSGSSSIPVTKLFGRSAAGLNATGEGDTRDYYDYLNSKQTAFLGPLLQRLYMALKTNVTDYEILFNPAWSPSQAELVDMRYKQAMTDKIYAQEIAGVDGKPVITVDEIRESRFSGGYSFETVLAGGKPVAPTEGSI